MSWTDYPRYAWWSLQYAEAAYWSTAFSTLGFGAARGAYTGNWKTFQTGLKLVDFGARAHVNSIRGVFNTPISRAANSRTLGYHTARFASGVAAGYAIGAVSGTAISYAAFGDEGAVLAADLYAPGGASFFEEGLLGMGDNISTIWGHYN